MNYIVETKIELSKEVPLFDSEKLGKLTSSKDTILKKDYLVFSIGGIDVNSWKF